MEARVPTVPISKFEHRVAQWAKHLKKTRQPLEISQHGRSDIVVLDQQTFQEWQLDRERLQALEIKLLVDAGERDIAAGRVYTHEQVGRMLRSNSLPQASRRRKRRS
jgi:PHD/YefM family antitoxin component YafN of YafNO toxin-antitoxin module